jgi:hypothetical protein
MPTVDSSNWDKSAALTETIALNHGPDVLVLVFAGDVSVGPSNPTQILVGGAPMQLYDTINFYTLWYIRRYAAVNENVVLTWPNAHQHCTTVVALANVSVNLFDSVNHIWAGGGVNINVPMPAGTPNRMLVQGFISWNTFALTGFTAGQTTVINTGFPSPIGIGYLNTENAVGMSLNNNGPPEWWSTVVGVMDISQDLLWKRRKRRYY